jgi:hypothetical protein
LILTWPCTVEDNYEKVWDIYDLISDNIEDYIENVLVEISISLLLNIS